ncbi:hypothetical protein BOTCAL_1038g00030 [Botryotinia calthae]|uniref:Uncharacterized protein n=1 Tax=Botryotinia calthae TaxID=38488 RepID=A0A4Y8CE66_9HELO|nr:hypothetical protein BOTCAL_1038g00030 [Botryotinia calthae]
MDEDNQNPYYPITNRQRYPSIPPQNAEVTAPSNQNIELQYQCQQLQYQNGLFQVHNEQLRDQNNQLQSQCNQIQIQHSSLQIEHSTLQLQYSGLQSYLGLREQALRRVSSASNLHRAASLIEHYKEDDASLAHASSADRRLYDTLRSQKIEPAIKEEHQIAPVIKEERQIAPVIKEEDDHSRPTPDRGYSPSPAGFFDEEMEDEDYKPIPAPIARATAGRATAVSATVAPHELRVSSTKDSEENMPIHHRMEFAYCEISMTKEEYFHVKGFNYDAPQASSMPNKNDNIQDRKRIRITWAERDRLNDWRVNNYRKKHELRGSTKYAAARDYWRLNPPFTVQPRKAIEWEKIR